jgi:hypothetical protein
MEGTAMSGDLVIETSDGKLERVVAEAASEA